MDTARAVEGLTVPSLALAFGWAVRGTGFREGVPLLRCRRLLPPQHVVGAVSGAGTGVTV